ncbi:hypothetical protein AZE42_07691 [Rhizopogon vesiculosus]|uniref:Uncharacterized protein n=1 Tax=Rhizopogon vesiculosus TaxID=180088 RepID=A0A1J8PLN6_9AGAM|nr:hypothetical protein AZE42_07691 [Rhizopogon vesiculosus]
MEGITTLNGDIPSNHHDTGNVAAISSEHSISGLNYDHGVEQVSVVQSKVQEQPTAVDPSCLLKDQRRAYDIINWHLTETLAGRAPLQLLMHIPGEGGVGKSKPIQTIISGRNASKSWSFRELRPRTPMSQFQ